MGRLVRKPRLATSNIEMMHGMGGMEGMYAGIGGVPPQQTEQLGDNYLERVAKYVPAEPIAFFIFINAILDQALRTGGKTAMMAGFPVSSIAVGALIAGMVLTPFFIWYVREDGDAWVVNAFVSTLAFPFWAYALGAVAFSDYRDGNLAAILLAIFTVVSGMISPRASRPKRVKEKKIAPPRDGPRLVEPGAA